MRRGGECVLSPPCPPAAGAGLPPTPPPRGARQGGSAGAPACPKRYDNKTQAVLHGMFMERIGGHILDSGDAYGRLGDAYRASPDLRAVPEIAACKDGGGAWAVRSSFHALCAGLEFSAELDGRFAEHCAAADNGGRKAWHELAEEFAAMSDKRFRWETCSHNTYMFDNPLDKAFEWVEFDAAAAPPSPARGERKEGGRRLRREPKRCRAALLQVHLGCDIRGGYGTPRAFVMRGGYSLKRASRRFEAACGCTRIECWGAGVVHNLTASEECEACAFRSDEDVENGVHPDGCICGEYPVQWKATGMPDGSIACGLCGGRVRVS